MNKQLNKYLSADLYEMYISGKTYSEAANIIAEKYGQRLLPSTMLKLINEYKITIKTYAHPWDSVAKNADWVKKHQHLVNLTHEHGSDEQIVFLGDSIIKGWALNGKEVWDMYYANRHAYNYGIGGDRTENVIYRLENNELDGLKPKVTVLMIGTNNLGGNTIEDIAKGVKKVLHQIAVIMPQSKVLLLAVLPRAEPLGFKAKQLNKLIAKMGDEKTFFYLNMWSAFVNSDGKQNTELYVPDKLHLNAAGYVVWQNTMEPLLIQLL